MTNAEFLNEVNNSGIAPNNFEHIYAEFQDYQRHAIDTLIEFHRVCELRGISYQLAYGSLLGAVRDNGQIPWDYDVDVFVPCEEREKLVQALKENLNSQFYFYCPEVDSKCRHVAMRVAPCGFRTEVMHVDVFFLSGTPDDSIEREKFRARMKKVSDIRFFKLVKIYNEETRGHYKEILRRLLGKIRYAGYSLKKAEKEYNTLCNMYPAKTSKSCISADIHAAESEAQVDVVWDTMLINTAIGQFRIPPKYNEILKKIYGDYMSVPPLENRIKEMMYHYAILKRFDRKK